MDAFRSRVLSRGLSYGCSAIRRWTRWPLPLGVAWGGGWRHAIFVGALLLSALLLGFLLWGDCGAAIAQTSKSEAPIPPATLAVIRAKDSAAAAPILIRAYKKESEFEVWKQNSKGRFVYIKTFPICRWSGQLGPKLKPGDRQSPEGFYSVSPEQMNPNSHYYLSFDTGYPNAYDKAHGGAGSALMVHGTCSSAGCYAMTDQGIAEIYALARDALRGGQQAFQFQAFPFHMTAQNMAKYRADPNIAFWRQLKEGSDRFEATDREPVVGVAAGRYVFEPYKDPDEEALARAQHEAEEARVAALIEEGSAAVRTTYLDGGQHPAFKALAAKGVFLGEVSRPEALAYAGVDLILVPARHKLRKCPGSPLCPTQTAARESADSKEAKAEPPPAAPPPLRGLETASTDPFVFAPQPMSYQLGRKPPPQTVMAGAMPILPAVWSY